MNAGIVALVAAYVMSQFFRAFLAVLTPLLQADIGATTDNLAAASGYWFLTFAAMQIPVGAALDRVGPRRTAALLLALGGGGGAALFASAQAPWQMELGMALIGIGCSPVLMAAYFIFARVYSARVFATLAGATIGIGSLGNIGSSIPLAWAVEAWGWRGTVWGLAAVTLVIAVALALTVRDPERVTHDHKGSVLTLLAMPALWPIMVMAAANYAPAAAIRGLWAGPYVADIFQPDPSTIGTVTLVMGLAMIAGNFAYGPMDRVFGSRKWVVFVGNALSMVGCFALAATSGSALWLSAVLFAWVGFFGASFPMVLAHGRALIPPHLTGRGVTLLNLCSLGAVGMAQFATRPFFEATRATEGAAHAYATIFAGFGGLLAVGLVVYLWSGDRTD